MPRDLSLSNLELVRAGGEGWIAANATLAPIALESPTPPGATILSVSVLQSAPLQHLALCVCLLTLWPADSYRRRATFLVLALPAAICATTLDVPFALVGLAHAALREHGAPEQMLGGALAFYSAFLADGGRLGLGLSVGALTALAAQTRDP
jgi:hypothetical protein